MDINIQALNDRFVAVYNILKDAQEAIRVSEGGGKIANTPFKSAPRYQNFMQKILCPCMSLLDECAKEQSKWDEELLRVTANPRLKISYFKEIVWQCTSTYCRAMTLLNEEELERTGRKAKEVEEVRPPAPFAFIS